MPRLLLQLPGSFRYDVIPLPLCGRGGVTFRLVSTVDGDVHAGVVSVLVSILISIPVSVLVVGTTLDRHIIYDRDGCVV